MKIVFKDPESLKAYQNNARRITDESIEYVKTSIINFGYLNPVVIDRKDVIVCGHVTVQAAIRCGMKKVACVLADDLTENEIKAFRLADNKVATMAIWDKEKLRTEFEFLVKTDFTFDQLGFDEGMVTETDVRGAAVNPTENKGGEVDLGEFEDEKFAHECPHCGLKFN